MNPPSSDPSLGPGLEPWCAPLQQASRLEAERGFGDLQGRCESFSGFVRRSLSETLPAGLAGSDQRQLQQLAEEFADYPAAGLGRRQQLVQKLRQGLHHPTVG
ncbi:MAG: hypothetical protein LW834_11325 [Cyanobium sp. 49614_E6]|nr:hypothetical protein [Cyanobium sp. 49614_E6]